MFNQTEQKLTGCLLLTGLAIYANEAEQIGFELAKKRIRVRSCEKSCVEHFGRLAGSTISSRRPSLFSVYATSICKWGSIFPGGVCHVVIVCSE